MSIRKTQFGLPLLLMAMLALVLTACSSSSPTSPSAQTGSYMAAVEKDQTPSSLCNAANGQALYEGQDNSSYTSKGCNRCHGDFSSTSVPKGTTVADIDAQRNPNTNSMMGTDAWVMSLTEDQIADIAYALGDVNGCEKAQPSPTPTATVAPTPTATVAPTPTPTATSTANPTPTPSSSSSTGIGVDIGGILNGSLGGSLNGLPVVGDLLNSLGGNILGGLPLLGGNSDLLGGLTGNLLGGNLLGGGVLNGVTGGNLLGGNLLGGSIIASLDQTLSTTAYGLLFNLDPGGLTSPIVSTAGNLLNQTVYPIVNPALIGLMVANDGLVNTLAPVSGLLQPVTQVVNNITDNTVPGVLKEVVAATGGQVVALIPMPLDPTKKCEDCHNSKTALIQAMVDPGNNLKYPGLAADVPFVANFFVDPSYTSLSDSMMSKAVKMPQWEGCQTCHGTGSTFNPFPTDNWVPNSNPNDGTVAATAFGTTNNAAGACGKCHSSEAATYNGGIMGTVRGHQWAFNYNDVEIESSNALSNWTYSPLGPVQSGTDMSKMPLDRNGKPVHAGYYQSRTTCTACHQGCSDCHMQGPGDSPIGLAGNVIDLLKVGSLSAAAEVIRVDQTHTAPAVRVDVTVANTLRRAGVWNLEIRKGYIPGVSRGIPMTMWEAAMDITYHKISKPTMAGQMSGNTMAPKSQLQSIQFCWRCHFRSAAEFTGNWINVVPNVNYSKKTLGHLQAGMSCTDCHNQAEVMGATSQTSQSFAGTVDGALNPAHDGGNPVGSTKAWTNTPNPIKVTCGLCHTSGGVALGPTGGLNWGNLVTAKYQNSATQVNGLGPMTVAGGTATNGMAHSNIKCETCHVQAQQNCWNCHVEQTKTALEGLPFIGSQDLGLDILPAQVNVREAEGIPALSADANALLKELPARNDAVYLSLALTFPDSPNTVNKSVRFLGRNNRGQIESVVHCPGNTVGINNPNRSPQPKNLDGGLYLTKSGTYGQDGAVEDPTTAPEGSWFMESGHSIAATPDGTGYTACYNCHADTVRLGKEPVTYYRKNPWVMQSIGDAQAIMPNDHFTQKMYLDNNGNYTCSCHSSDGKVHNGSSTGPWPLDILPDNNR